MKPTLEQQTIIDTFKSTKQNIVISAGAGCAKSSSMLFLAEANPDINFLLLTFDKANAVKTSEDSRKPDNLTAKTLHSIAYQYWINHPEVGKVFNGKLNAWLDYKEIDNKKIEGILRENQKTYIREKGIYFNKLFREIIAKFCQSDYYDIEMFSQTYLLNMFSTPESNELGIVLTSKQISSLLYLIEEYWEKLTNFHNKVKITHDIYLKLYQINDVVFDSGFDVIILDEAQDSNPCTIDIFENQKQRKIVVGDKYQQAYIWRGSFNCLDYFKNDSTFTTCYLTGSFRFNKEIEDLANIVLDKAESDFKVKGLSNRETIETTAYLCRTNAGVLHTLSNLLANNIVSTENTVKIELDLKTIFSHLFYLQACFFNEKPKFFVPELAHIVDKATLMEALEYNYDLSRLNDLGKVLRDKFGSLGKARELFNYVINKDSLITISTIHKSKGLEYDEVFIGEDFLRLENEDDEEEVFKELESFENQCLLYIALTRAKVKTNYPNYLKEYLNG